MKTLVVSNQKGGVGKTTLAVHLALAAHKKGLRVLLVDFDTQQNAGMMFVQTEPALNFLTSSALFLETASTLPLEYVNPTLAIIRADKKGLVLIEDNKSVGSGSKFPALRLKEFDSLFDVCIIDTPPAMGILLNSALVAANQVLTPVKMGRFETSGFADLLDNIKKIRSSGLNPRLKHIGSIAMRINTRSAKQLNALAEFRQAYPSAMLSIMLPEREAVQVAINEGRAVWDKIDGASHKKTAQEWRDGCEVILNLLTA